MEKIGIWKIQKDWTKIMSFSAFSDLGTIVESTQFTEKPKAVPKGISGNPLGKPHKYKKLADRLNLIGKDDDWLNKPMGHTYREGVLRKIWEKASQGDFKFIQLLAYLGVWMVRIFFFQTFQSSLEVAYFSNLHSLYLKMKKYLQRFFPLMLCSEPDNSPFFIIEII